MRRTTPNRLSTATGSHRLFSPKWLMLAILLVFGCDLSVKDPVLPTWSVELNVPIGNETFKLREIVNDSTIVVQGADSALFLSFDGDLESIEISAADFNAGAVDTTHSFELGNLKLNNLEALKSGQITLGSFFPELANLVSGGQTIPFSISDTTFDPAPSRLNSNDFVGFRVTDGQLRLRFTNTMPIPVGPNPSQPNGFEVSVTDSFGTELVTFLIDEVVTTGNTVERVAELNSDIWIYAPLHLDFVLPIAEPTAFQLSSQTLNESGVELDVVLEQMEVDEAIARIEQQETTERGGFQLDDRASLSEAVIESGRIQLDFLNQTNVDMQLEYRMPNIITTSGLPYSGVMDVPQNGTALLDVPLNNMRLANPDNPGEYIDSIFTEYRIITDPTANIVHLRATDKVSIGVQIDSIIFQSMRGYLENQVFEIEPYEETDVMDYEDIPDNIRLENVNFMLKLSNEFYIEDMTFDLTIVGYHEKNGVVTDSARLELVNQQIEPGYPGNPGISYISVPGDVAADFLNVLPTRIRTYGQAVGNGAVEINQNSLITGNYSFSTPFRLRIEGDALYTGDVNELTDDDIDQDIRDASDENLEQAELSLNVLNGTPLSGSIRLVVSADPQHTDIYDSTYFNAALEFTKTIALSPATVNSTTGYVDTPQQSQVFLSLTQDEFRIFKNTPVNVGFELRLDDAGETVALRASDFVTVSGLAQVKVVIKD